MQFMRWWNPLPLLSWNQKAKINKQCACTRSIRKTEWEKKTLQYTCQYKVEIKENKVVCISRLTPLLRIFAAVSLMKLVSNSF